MSSRGVEKRRSLRRSEHPGACGTAFHALVEATSPDRLSLPAYQPCLAAVQAFIARQAKKARAAAATPLPSGYAQSSELLML